MKLSVRSSASAERAAAGVAGMGGGTGVTTYAENIGVMAVTKIYSTLLFADDSKDRIRQQFLAWTGCIGEFRNFLKDPNAYLAAAP